MVKIIKATKAKNERIERKRVAAYCRVSTLQDSQQGSYDLQVRYFENLIKNNPEWEFVGIFSDHGISGSGIKKRAGFRKMIESCDQGKIDLIITKSIKRFARNTVDLLNTINHLKKMGIEVFFENENIRTLSAEGDFMLTILASFAQEEIRSLSKNLKWAVKKKFEQGEVWAKPDCFGYQWDGDQYQIVPEQAVIVERIFDEFLSGKKMVDIAHNLNVDKVPRMHAGRWDYLTIGKILRNESYTGNLLLQKYWTKNPFDHGSVKNKGDLDQYFVQNTHDPIIGLDRWRAVQKMLTTKDEYQQNVSKLPFEGRIFCQKCGLPYWHHNGYWDCKSRYEKWKKKEGEVTCPPIPTYALEEAACEALEVAHVDKDLFRRRIKAIFVQENSALIVEKFDGSRTEHAWARRWKKPDQSQRDTMAKKYSTRDSNPWAKQRGDLCCFVKCGVCQKNFVRNGRNDQGDYRFRAPCKHQKAFWESEMKNLIATALGLESFDVIEMDKAMTHCEVSDRAVTFFFRDGSKRVEVAPWQK